MPFVDSTVFSSVRILVVEDDTAMTYSIFWALQNNLPRSSSVRVAYTLEDAKEWVHREMFHAVLIDYRLPDGTGMDLVELLRSQDRFGRPALFVISGFDPDELAIANLLMKYPDITFIEKPFRFEELANIIMDTLLPGSVAEQTYYGLQVLDLVQAYCVARRSATVRVLTPEGKMGVIAVNQGEIVHASMEGVDGVEAIRKIAAHKQGKIRLDRGCPTTRHTIQQAAAQLLHGPAALEENPAGPRPAPAMTAPLLPPVLPEDLDDHFRQAYNL